VFGSAEAQQAAARLKEFVAACEDYAGQVFLALHEDQKDPASAGMR